MYKPQSTDLSTSRDHAQTQTSQTLPWPQRQGIAKVSDWSAHTCKGAPTTVAQQLGERKGSINFRGTTQLHCGSTRTEIPQKSSAPEGHTTTSTGNFTSIRYLRDRCRETHKGNSDWFTTCWAIWCPARCFRFYYFPNPEYDQIGASHQAARQIQGLCSVTLERHWH